MGLLLLLIFVAFLISIPAILYGFAFSMTLVVSASAFMFGLTGALLMVPLKSFIDGIALKVAEQHAFYLAQGKVRFRIEKEKYANYYLEDNILWGQTSFALIGGCIPYIYFGRNIWLFIIIAASGLSMFIYFIIIRYYEMIKDEIHVDMLTVSYSDEGGMSQ